MSKFGQRLLVYAGLVVLTILAVVPPCMAQTNRGSITGVVSDSSGGLVVGAAITAINSGTNVRTTATSGTGGNFTVPLLQVGQYQLTVEHPGFKKFVQGNIIVNIAQITHVDAKLEVGQVSESVEVSAQAVIVQADSSERGVIISGQQVLDLPLVGVQEVRNPAFFISLVPGVTSRGTAYGTYSGGGRQLNTTVNGSPSASIEWLLDGANIGQGYMASGSFQQLPFPPDVVGEYNVMTLLPPAEFGQTGLGITNFTLKSGGNGIHGTVYEYFRNTALDARGFYAAKTPRNLQNEFGTTIGGPIHKDKTFFYGWYTGFRNIKEPGANSTDTVPTDAMKSGDLSNILGPQIGTDALGRPVLSNAIYDPATTRLVPAGAVDPGTGLVNSSGAAAWMRDAFPGNIIPSNRIDPVAKNMFSYFPSVGPCSSCRYGYLQNWTGAGITSTDSINNWGVKIDQVFNDKNRLYGSYIWKSEYVPAGSKYPDPIGEGSFTTNGWRVLRLSEDYFIKPNVVNHWTFGFNRNSNESLPTAGFGWPATLGYSGVPQTGLGSVFPESDISGLGATYARQGVNRSANNNFSIEDSITWIKGKHTFKGGFSYMKLQVNQIGTTYSASYNQYNAGPTGLMDPKFFDGGCAVGGNCTGMGIGSFLLGFPTSGTVGITATEVADRNGRYAGYFQDDYKMTSKLTFNLGLRWDWFRPTVDAHNQKSWLDPFVFQEGIGLNGSMVFASDARRAASTTYMKNVGPRFGFAYSLNPKTVIRGGYGMLYTAGPSQRSLANAWEQLGYNGSQGCNQSSLGGFSGAVSCSPPGHADVHMTLATGWPAQYFGPVGTLTPDSFNGQGPPTWGPWPGDEIPPNIQTAHFSIQRQLPGQILLDVGYVWTKGTHLSSRLMHSNVVDTKYIGFGADLFKNIADPSIQALPIVQAMPVDPGTGMHTPFTGFENLWGAGAQLGQALRPMPQYRNDSVQGLSQLRDYGGETQGMSTYNALQIQARKNLSYGLSFLVSYTWSKTLTNAGSLINEFSGFTQDFYNAAGERALSLNDYPSNLAISYQYELPFGAGKKYANGGGVSNKVLGGWSIAGFQSYRSGAPQGVFSSGNSLNPYMSDNGFTTRANRIPGVEKYSDAWLNGTWDPNGVGVLGQRYNVNGWADPSPYTFGNAPVTDGDIRQLPYLNEDISIIKRTNINERVSVEFRCDFLNAFNRVLFGFDQGGDQYGQAINGGSIGGGVNSSFGRVAVQTNSPREIQFGLKINY